MSVPLNHTPKQIAIFKFVKAELTARDPVGETNLRIKYQNGIQTIISVERGTDFAQQRPY